jgi:hypothetical protein
MDRLTLTGQFWISFRIFLGKFQEESGIIWIPCTYKIGFVLQFNPTLLGPIGSMGEKNTTPQNKNKKEKFC